MISAATLLHLFHNVVLSNKLEALCLQLFLALVLLHSLVLEIKVKNNSSVVKLPSSGVGVASSSSVGSGSTSSTGGDGLLIFSISGILGGATDAASSSSIFFSWNGYGSEDD